MNDYRRAVRWILIGMLAGLAALPVRARQEAAPPKALLPNRPVRVWLPGNPLTFVYTAASGQTISLYATSLPGSEAVDTTLEIFDPGGDSLAFSDDLVAGKGDAGIENLALPAAGDYTIRLDTSIRGQTGGVGLRLSVGATAAVEIPAESAIILGTARSGTLANARPTAFLFTADAGEVITITAQATRPPSPEVDLVLTVYGPNDRPLPNGYDDDSGAAIGLGERDPALRGLRLPEAGVYRIEVSSWFGYPAEFRISVQPG